MFLQVAALIANAIRVLKSSEESDLFEDVLPLLQALLPAIGHLLDGHHFGRDIIPRIIDGAEAAVTNLAQIIEQLVRILALKQQRHIRVSQTARPEKNNRNHVIS